MSRYAKECDGEQESQSEPMVESNHISEQLIAEQNKV